MTLLKKKYDLYHILKASKNLRQNASKYFYLLHYKIGELVLRKGVFIALAVAF